MKSENEACRNDPVELEQTKGNRKNTTFSSFSEGSISPLYTEVRPADLAASALYSQVTATVSPMEEASGANFNLASASVYPSKNSVAVVLTEEGNELATDDIAVIKRMNEDLRERCADQGKQLELLQQQVALHRQNALDAQMSVIRVESERDELRNTMRTLYEHMAHLTRLLPRTDPVNGSSSSETVSAPGNDTSGTMLRLQGMLEQLIAFYNERRHNEELSAMAVGYRTIPTMIAETGGGSAGEASFAAGDLNSQSAERAHEGEVENSIEKTKAKESIVEDALTELAVLLMTVGTHLETLEDNEHYSSDTTMQQSSPQGRTEKNASINQKNVCSSQSSVHYMLSSLYQALENGLKRIKTMTEGPTIGSDDVREPRDSDRTTNRVPSPYSLLYPTYAALLFVLETMQRTVVKVMASHRREVGERGVETTIRREDTKIDREERSSVREKGIAVINGMVSTPPRASQKSPHMIGIRGTVHHEASCGSRGGCEHSRSCSTLSTAVLLLSRAYSGATRDVADLLWQRQRLLHLVSFYQGKEDNSRSLNKGHSLVHRLLHTDRRVPLPMQAYTRSIPELLSQGVRISPWCRGVLRFRVRVIVVLAVGRFRRCVCPQERECIRVVISGASSSSSATESYPSQTSSLSPTCDRRPCSPTAMWIRLRLPRSSRVVLKRGDDVTGDHDLRNDSYREVTEQEVCTAVTHALNGSDLGDSTFGESSSSSGLGVRDHLASSNQAGNSSNVRDAYLIVGLLVSLQQLVEEPEPSSPDGQSLGGAHCCHASLVQRLRKGLHEWLTLERRQLKLEKRDLMEEVHEMYSLDQNSTRVQSMPHHTQGEEDAPLQQVAHITSSFSTVPSSVSSATTSPLPPHIYLPDPYGLNGFIHPDMWDRGADSRQGKSPPTLRRTPTPTREKQGASTLVGDVKHDTVVDDDLSGLFADEVLRVLNALDQRVTVALDRSSHT